MKVVAFFWTLVPSVFYERFTAATTRFLRAVLGVVLGHLGEAERPLGGALAAFREVLAADATLVQLHRLLAQRYPGSRTHSSPAAAKLHVVMSVTGAGAKSVKITHGRACEHRVLHLPEASEYRFYRTNILPETLSPEQVAQTYAARWTVELAFAELKSHYRLDELPSRKAHGVEALLLTAVLTMLVSRRLLEAVRAQLTRAQRRAPEGRWAALFASVAPVILTLLLSPRRLAEALACPLERMLLHEASDPNRSRDLLLDRVQNGTVWGLT